MADMVLHRSFRRRCRAASASSTGNPGDHVAVHLTKPREHNVYTQAITVINFGSLQYLNEKAIEVCLNQDAGFNVLCWDLLFCLRTPQEHVYVLIYQPQTDRQTYCLLKSCFNFENTYN